MVEVVSMECYLSYPNCTIIRVATLLLSIRWRLQHYRYFFVSIFNHNPLLTLGTHRPLKSRPCVKTISTIILEDASSPKSRPWQDFQRSRNMWLDWRFTYIWTLAELNLRTGCLPFMLPLLPVRDATSDKGAITGGGVGVVGRWLMGYFWLIWLLLSLEVAGLIKEVQ